MFGFSARTADIYAIQEYVVNGNASASGGYNPVSPVLVAGQKTIILAVVGQSLASGNNGTTLYTPINSLVQMLNIYDGTTYTYKEPVLGADGTKSQFMGRLGDLLINSGTCARVIFIPAAIGGSSSYLWAQGGSLNHRVSVLGLRARSLSWPINAVLVEQGQSDSAEFEGGLDTPDTVYQANWIGAQTTLQGLGIDVPWLFAISTASNNIPDANIQRATRGLVNPKANRFIGANTDSLLGPSYRLTGGTHMTDTGITSQAALWQTALTNAGIK